MSDSVTVHIPAPLRKLTNEQDSVTANESSTLAALIDTLEGQFPGLKERLCDETGALRRFVNVYVNGEDVRFLSGLETPIQAGTEISIVPAAAGGARDAGELRTTADQRGWVRENIGLFLAGQKALSPQFALDLLLDHDTLTQRLALTQERLAALEAELLFEKGMHKSRIEGIERVYEVYFRRKGLRCWACNRPPEEEHQAECFVASVLDDARALLKTAEEEEETK